MGLGIICKWFGEQFWFKKLNRAAVEEIDHGNVQAGIPFAALISVIEISMLVASFLLKDQWDNSRWLWKYRMAYAGLLISSLVFLRRCIFCRRGRQTQHGYVARTIYSYVIVCILFGVCISILDYGRSYSSMTFITMEVMTFGLFLLQPLFSLLIITASFILFISLLNEVSTVTTGTAVNLIFLLMGVIVINVIRFRMQLRMLDTNEKLVRSFSEDGLTGMKNRVALRKDRKYYVGSDVILAMLDLDDMKFYNDTYGHDAGDEILSKIGEVTISHFGFQGSYRYGGDECLIVLENVSVDDFIKKMELWRKDFYQCVWDKYHFHPTCSAGYVYGRAETLNDLRGMVKLADMKMYEAKGRGKNLMIGEAFDCGKLEEGHFMDAAAGAQKEGIDPLTGLFNMMYFRNKARILIDALDEDRQISFIYFNLSNFKKYNEEYGFHAGDAFLKAVADILCEIYEHCLVCHLSDDHFAVMTYEDAVEEKIGTVHGRVLDYSKRPMMMIRAGICEYGNGMEDVSTIIDRARLACDNIRDRYDVFFRYYDRELEQKRNRQQYIIEHIDEAISENYIQTYYQPIVRAITGEMCGAEALARWNDPKYGLLRPGDFTEILESFHLIQKLDFYMIERVCKDYVQHMEQGEPFPPVSVNLSRQDFRLFDVTKMIIDILDRYGMPRNMLHVEITESALSDDYEELIGKIEELRNAGFEVWLDDFGSGYSSLNILQDCVFDVIKIDMLFLKNFDQNQNSHLIISSVVDMAKELGVQTLTEGVETPRQLDFLKKIGCERVQGYFFSKPVPVAQLGASANGEKIRIEDAQRYLYYNAIGRVNLLKPMLNEMAYLAHRNAGVVPMAVLQYDGNSFTYLEMNEEYAQFLEDSGMNAQKREAGFFNCLAGVDGHLFRKTVEECIDSGEWENFVYMRDGICCSLHIRYIAQQESAGVIAILIMAMNMSRMRKTHSAGW
ncbi:MAG: bifunctional diguanylate cyclase/phosphodiesterase [Butyrivibrio sp.]|nr:bifunctional diguanylate cyclase/phosphodiesterase [Butyrivibrio sp.]